MAYVSNFVNICFCFSDYLGVLCQHLYDTLRPSLITINHVEVLGELCGILQKEMLNDKIIRNGLFYLYSVFLSIQRVW